MVQLFFDEKQQAEWAKLTKDLAVKYKTENVTDTALEAVRRAHTAAYKSR